MLFVILLLISVLLIQSNVFLYIDVEPMASFAQSEMSYWATGD